MQPIARWSAGVPHGAGGHFHPCVPAESEPSVELGAKALGIREREGDQRGG